MERHSIRLSIARLTPMSLTGDHCHVRLSVQQSVPWQANMPEISLCVCFCVLRLISFPLMRLSLQQTNRLSFRADGVGAGITDDCHVNATDGIRKQSVSQILA